ncbi:MAG: 50S ribosomal protein L17 [Actinomycetota bacterium]
MPKPTKGPRLGSGPTHQKMMLAGLTASLIRDERIRTTEAKAKRMRPLAEKMVTLGKSGDVHARRQALSVIEDRDIVHKLFADIAPRFSERNGGYTRILKLGPRKGDAAPMAIIEFVEGEAVVTTSETTEETKRRGLRRRKGASGSKGRVGSAGAPADATSQTPAAEESDGLGESPQPNQPSHEPNANTADETAPETSTESEAAPTVSEEQTSPTADAPPVSPESSASTEGGSEGSGMADSSSPKDSSAAGASETASAGGQDAPSEPSAEPQPTEKPEG